MPGNADSIFRAKETKSKKAERKCDKEGRNRKNDTQDPEETPVIVDVKMFSPSKHHRAHWKHIPWKHQRMFRDIRTLGRIQFDSYWDHPTPEASQYPWRKERIKRAETLVHFAEKCAKLEQLLEADWRAEVEPRIFDRFSIEVAWYVYHRVKSFALVLIRDLVDDVVRGSGDQKLRWIQRLVVATQNL